MARLSLGFCWAFIAIYAVCGLGVLQPTAASAQQQDLFRSSINSAPVTSLQMAELEAYTGQWREGVPASRVNAKSLEIFQNIPFTGWLKAKNHRAFCHWNAGVLSLFLAINRLPDRRNGGGRSAALLHGKSFAV